MGISTRRTDLPAPTIGSYGRQGRVNASRKRKRKRLLEEQTLSSSILSQPRTRAKLEEINSIINQTPSPQRYKVTTPPESGIKTRSSKGNPTCLSFGKVRHALYGNEYFLCHACDMWEADHKIMTNIT